MTRRRCRFVGARRGLEAKARALDGFPVTLLPGRGLVRRVSLPEPACQLGGCRRLRVPRWLWLCPVLFEVAARGRGLARGLCQFRLRRGGLSLWRVPIVVVNVDAVPGSVNRLAARVAAACAVLRPKSTFVAPFRLGSRSGRGLAAIRRGPVSREAARNALGLPPQPPSRGRLGWLARLAADKPGHCRTGGPVGRTNRRRHPSCRWPPGLGRAPHGRPACHASLVYQQVKYEEDMASLTVPPTWLCNGREPIPSPSWRWPGSLRYSCRCPVLPGTTRVPMQGRWRLPGAPWSSRGRPSHRRPSGQGAGRPAR